MQRFSLGQVPEDRGWSRRPTPTDCRRGGRSGQRSRAWHGRSADGSASPRSGPRQSRADLPCGCQPPAVRTESDVPDGAGVSREGLEHTAGGEIPERDQRIPAAVGQPLTVRTDRNRADLLPFLAQGRGDLAARRWRPRASGPIPAGGDQAAAVWAVSYIRDRTGMAFQGVGFGGRPPAWPSTAARRRACGDIPEFHGPVLTRGR